MQKHYNIQQAVSNSTIYITQTCQYLPMLQPRVKIKSSLNSIEQELTLRNGPHFDLNWTGLVKLVVCVSVKKCNCAFNPHN